jgi:hypothetical protein
LEDLVWQCNVIADSVNPAGVRLTTLELEYPYIIHGEVMTHRVFSRNAASNRAIPAKRFIEKVETDPFIPEYWTLNEPGMVGRKLMTPEEADVAHREWLAASYAATRHAMYLGRQGAHKQLVNRLLMPFQWIRVIVTSTEWDNFFLQRRDPSGWVNLEFPAEPHMQKLACFMWEALRGSSPDSLGWGEWHLPYIFRSEKPADEATLAKLSVARCARVSYLNHDGKRDIEEDLRLHDRLIQERHPSPLEHAAVAEDPKDYTSPPSNFHPSWQQYRKTFPWESGRSETFQGESGE